MQGKILKYSIRTALVLILCAALVIVQHLRRDGVFKSLQPHFAGSCKAWPLNGTVEDIQIDRTTGIAYFAVLGQDGAGTILQSGLSGDGLVLQAALAAAPPDFRPRSISLYIDIDGSQRLFALSSPPGQPPAIEIFVRAADGRFAHAETLHNPLLFKPSAIVGVGPRQFYVTNASGARGAFERVTEELFRRARSSVVYFDGEVMRVVDDAVASGRGIAASADGGRLYVSAATSQDVRIYARDSGNGDLTFLESVDIYTAAGKINVAEDGAIWVAAYPKLPAFTSDPGAVREPVPTQILRVLSDPRAEIRASEVYLNAGEQISAGSAAAVQAQRMLVGSFSEHKVLDCRLPT